MSKFKNIDFLVPLLLLGYSLFYYLEVRSLDSADTALLLIEPVFFILVVSVVLYILLQLGKKGGKSQDNSQDENLKKPRIQRKKTIYFCVSTLLYIFLLGVLGFIVSTLIYTVFLMILLGVRSIKFLLPIPMVLIGILYISLEVWLNIPLPKGFLI